MQESLHHLKSFAGKSCLSGLEVTAKIRREGDLLLVHFSLRAPREELRKLLWLPGAGSSPVRKDELWKSTCFEAFVGPRTSEEYFEFNVAPSGDWNVYHFDSYRAGMKTVLPDLQSTPLKSQNESLDTRELALAIDCARLDLRGPLTLGVTAVLEFGGGEKDYWALSHQGSKPDFHLRSSWEFA